MPPAEHGGRGDRPGERIQHRVDALKNRVLALENQGKQTQRIRDESEAREQMLRRHNAVLTHLSLNQAPAAGNVRDAYREICIAAAHALNLKRVSIWRFNKPGTLLRTVYIHDTRGDDLGCKRILEAEKFPMYFEALRHGRTLPADDACHDPRTRDLCDDYLLPCRIGAMLDAPVRIDGQVVGVICHEQTDQPRQWTMDELTFAGSMADFVSLTLQGNRRQKAERATERQRAFLRQIIDTSPSLIFVMNRDGRLQLVNRALADATQTEPRDLIGQIAYDFVTDPDQASRLRRMDIEILDGRQESVAAVEQFTARDGVPRWFQIDKRPINALDGSERQILGVATDMTERKLYEDRLATLVRELDHRVKNNLFAVMIMAEQSAASADSLEQFVPAFSGRIRAMAVAHEMLASANWQGAHLRDLLLRLVQPYTMLDPQRVQLNGDDILLPPSIAPAVSMMVQELITNAVQHGSLSVPDGEVSIDWDCESGRLHLHWQEAGGPAVTEPQRQGFGLELVARTAQHQLRGDAALQFDQPGFRCHLSIPLQSNSQEESAAPAPEN